MEEVTPLEEARQHRCQLVLTTPSPEEARQLHRRKRQDNNKAGRGKTAALVYPFSLHPGLQQPFSTSQVPPSLFSSTYALSI
ncbi:hypothetical protein U1Q18_000445 [Sarracenia purpurea var. burkii]